MKSRNAALAFLAITLACLGFSARAQDLNPAAAEDACARADYGRTCPDPSVVYASTAPIRLTWEGYFATNERGYLGGRIGNGCTALEARLRPVPSDFWRAYPVRESPPMPPHYFGAGVVWERIDQFLRTDAGGRWTGVLVVKERNMILRVDCSLERAEIGIPRSRTDIQQYAMPDDMTERLMARAGFRR